MFDPVARLDGESARQVFRSVLEAFANPGRLISLPACAVAGMPPVMLPALALGDIEVSTHVAAADPAVAQQLGALLARATGTRIVEEPEAADMVVSIDGLDADLVGRLRIGSADAPEFGARVFAGCAALADGARVGDGGGVSVWAVGPGSSGGRLVRVDHVDESTFDRIHDVNAGYPAGIDVVFISDDGTAVGFPRSCRIEILSGIDR